MTKILKLHGDLRRSADLYFSLDQLLEFHQDVKEYFTDLSAQRLLAVGYSFGDLDVLRAISLDGGKIFYVAQAEPNEIVKQIMSKRESGDDQYIITGQDGDFDRFFEQLAAELGI